MTSLYSKLGPAGPDAVRGNLATSATIVTFRQQLDSAFAGTRYDISRHMTRVGHTGGVPAAWTT